MTATEPKEEVRSPDIKFSARIYQQERGGEGGKEEQQVDRKNYFYNILI